MAESHADRRARIELEDEAEQRRLIKEALAAMTPEDRAAMGIPESLGIEGMGWKLRASGQSLAHVVLLILVAGFIGYMVWDHDRRNVERAAAVVAASKEIAQKQVEVKEGLAEVVYVLTLGEADRKALRMDMPDSLRKRRDPR